MTAQFERGVGLRIELKPSRLQQMLAMALHGMAATALILASLPTGIQWIGFAYLLLSLIRQTRDPQPALAGYAVNSLNIDADGTWHFKSSDRVVSARLLDSTKLWARAMFLRFAVDGRRSRLLLTTDSTSPDEFRRLQVYLRTNPSA